ncbi:alpha/beta fold hydrolase [Histidinibacterium lentulum]|nr:alpha/beta fold hydrolase [Histidinibacterium lentulum]
MIHGFKFDPDSEAHDPHAHILSLRPRRDCWKAVSWPRHLGLSGKAGLAIGFGWPARGSIWRAWAEAGRAGRRLSQLVERLREVAPDRPVHLIGHSLGARVALAALPGLPAGAVGRLILISAAVFRAETMRVLKTPAGRAAEIVNVTGRENLVFDLLLRAALPHRGPTLGRGGPGGTRWLDLKLDRVETLAGLRDLGFRIRPAGVRICHWSGYLRPGVFSLYRALVLKPERTPLAVLHLRTVGRQEDEGRRSGAARSRLVLSRAS